MTSKSVDIKYGTAQRVTLPLVSRGGFDEINPADIVHGEYSSANDKYGSWIDVVYLDDEILRTHSSAVSPHHPVIEELKILLRDEKVYYVVPIKELASGFAFKRKDITDIKVTSLIQGNARHVPSCVWSVYFQDGKTRTLEVDYQSYFAYGNVTRPASMTNVTIMEKVFGDTGNA